MTSQPRNAEFPGFALPGAPVFNGASGASIFAGTMEEPLVVLDLAMVFGSRLWGHDHVAAARPEDAPGLGDLYTHEWRRMACNLLTDSVSGALGEMASDWRALVLHTGSEAVETAIKTALRADAQQRTGMHAFEGGYHGTFGLALAVTHRAEFREPWASQYGQTVRWTPWGEVPILAEDVSCVVVEPWLGRAGVIPPPPGFHAGLREECDRVGATLILDAVLCGGGRTGVEIAACIREANPDVVCLGKAIGGGAVASAVVARSAIAHAAWDKGPVEPAHTSTHLGDPAASAGIVRALQNLDERGGELFTACDQWRTAIKHISKTADIEARGLGMLWALDTGRVGGGLELSGRLLNEHRMLVVPSGADSSSITLYPSVATSADEIERFVDAITSALAHH